MASLQARDIIQRAWDLGPDGLPGNSAAPSPGLILPRLARKDQKVSVKML